MKRPHSDPESLITMGSSGEKGICGRGLQSMMDGLVDDDDDDCCGDEELYASQAATAAAAGGGGEKKRRLSTEQVRALEKNFEVENKLEPERKVRLAHELGLQPRQVAVWFQNRRARWKTKQLERDYAALQASCDTLRFDYDNLLREKESLMAEIKVLKAKLSEESLSFSSGKEELAASKADDKVAAAPATSEEPPALIYKDGSSVDSDSSAVLTDETRGGLSSSATGLGSYSSFPADSLPFTFNPDARTSKGGGFSYQQHVLKMEESEFLSSEEPCSSFFSDEQAPTLNWYYSDHWNLK